MVASKFGASWLLRHVPKAQDGGLVGQPRRAVQISPAAVQGALVQFFSSSRRPYLGLLKNHKLFRVDLLRAVTW